MERLSYGALLAGGLAIAACSGDGKASTEGAGADANASSSSGPSSGGVDGQMVVDTFPWPGARIAGAFLTGKANFQ